MRSYFPNSPEAAARIVALVMIADGQVSRSEIETLNRLGIERELGMSRGAFRGVLQALCEDLLDHADRGRSATCSVDEATLAALMAEITCPELRNKVLRLAVLTAAADQELDNAEGIVVAAARGHWGRSVDTPRTTPAEARVHA